MKQFEDVSSSWGAPMGRSEYGRTPSGESGRRSVSLFLVRFVDGDYDDGGAYWGGGSASKPLYCARSRDGAYRAFSRASCRAEAAESMDLDDDTLARPLSEREREEWARVKRYRRNRAAYA